MLIKEKIYELEKILKKELIETSINMKENLFLLDTLNKNIISSWPEWLEYFETYNKEIVNKNRDANYWKDSINNLRLK